MDIKINYVEELEQEAKDQITFIREEFEALFSKKPSFNDADRKTAMDLLSYLSRIIDTTTCMDFLAKTLEYLEAKFPGLF